MAHLLCMGLLPLIGWKVCQEGGDSPCTWGALLHVGMISQGLWGPRGSAVEMVALGYWARLEGKDRKNLSFWARFLQVLKEDKLCEKNILINCLPWVCVFVCDKILFYYFGSPVLTQLTPFNRRQILCVCVCVCVCAWQHNPVRM